jgi:hypothetical protein
MACHAIDELGGELAERFVQGPQLGRHKPRLCQQAMGPMIRFIHMHQCSNGLNGAGYLADLLFLFLGSQQRSRRIEEELGLLLDLQDIGMLADGPKRPAAVRRGPTHGCL